MRLQKYRLQFRLFYKDSRLPNAFLDATNSESFRARNNRVAIRKALAREKRAYREERFTGGASFLILQKVVKIRGKEKVTVVPLPPA